MPREGSLAEFGNLLAVAQHNGILADQVDTADMAVEIDPDTRPVQPRATCSIWVDLPVP